MCSNADEESEGVLLMSKADSTMVPQWCRKCCSSVKTKASVVLRKKDAYCKKCFLASVNHKFRACLGKTKVMRPGDKALVAFSGNVGSIALLHLIQIGLQDTSHKKLMFEPFLAFVDETSVLNTAEEESKSVMENITAALQDYKYPQYTVPLAMSLKSDQVLETHLRTLCANGNEAQSAICDDTTLRQLFDSVSEASARVDLLNKLRTKLIVRIAKCLGCSKVFTAESADDLAVKLFANISLGRGAQLPFDVGFSDDRDPGVKVIRPLRDLSKKELAFYNVFQGLSSVHYPSLTTKVDTNSSIQKLTESFLCELQEGFPSTLSTVFRVADKLATSGAERDDCALCHAPLDTENVASSSLSATQFSGLLSSLGPTNYDAELLQTKVTVADSSCCKESDNTETQRCCGGRSCSKENTKEELQLMLCYGCNLILKNAEVQTLPPSLIRHLRESTQRVKMKKEIEDFLL